MLVLSRKASPVLASSRPAKYQSPKILLPSVDLLTPVFRRAEPTFHSRCVALRFCIFYLDRCGKKLDSKSLRSWPKKVRLTCGRTLPLSDLGQLSLTCHQEESAFELSEL